MLTVWLVLLILVNAGWLATVLFMLPGNWLMVVSTCLFAWWKWDTGVFSWPLLAGITVLALAGELIEFLPVPAAPKKPVPAGRALLGPSSGLLQGLLQEPPSFRCRCLEPCWGPVWGQDC